jgi:hypothetical protein
MSVLDLTITRFLQVDVTCTDDKSGKSCNAIDTPEAACGDGIDTLMFTYIGGNCEQSVNSQDGFECQDTYGGPSEDDDARIECTDADGAEVFSGVVAVGDQISFGDKKDLPDVIYCAVKDNEGSMLQEFSIRTTDYDDLYLKDIFGSLQLESCDNHECLIDVTYVYYIKNDGSTSLEITSVDRSREGTTDDVTGLVKDGNLNAGDTALLRPKASHQLEVMFHPAAAWLLRPMDCRNEKFRSPALVEKETVSEFDCFSRFAIFETSHLYIV